MNPTLRARGLTSRATGRGVRWQERLAVALLTAFIFAVRVRSALVAGAPTLFGDESIPRFNAEAMAHLASYATAHYPPVYSLLELPFVIEAVHYDAMLVASSAVASLLVPLTWALARTIRVPGAVWAAVLAASMSFHPIYSQFLLAENLGLPLFVGATIIAMRGRRGEAVGLGVLLALLYLTKYLYLPAVPVLLLAWLTMLARAGSNVPLGVRIRNAVRPTVVALMGFALILLPWIFYGMWSGIAIRKLLGMNVSPVRSVSLPEAATAKWLIFWFFAYAAYLLLASLPVWLLLLTRLMLRRESGSSIRGKRPTAQGVYLVAVGALVLGFILVGAVHSAGVAYNHPTPSHLMGRYLLQCAPLLTVLGIMLVDEIRWRRVALSVVRVGLAFISISIASVVAWGVLFSGYIWELPNRFARMASITPEVFMFDRIWVFAPWLGAAVLTTALALMKRPPAQTFVPWSVAAVLVMVATFVSVVDGRPPQHASAIAACMRRQPDLASPAKIVLIGVPGAHSLPTQIEFFNGADGEYTYGVSKDRYEVEAFDPRDAAMGSITDADFVVSPDVYAVAATCEYQMGDERYVVWTPDGLRNVPVPRILDYGPGEFTAGEGFNIQPSGDSAVWLRVDRATPTMQLVANGERLPSSVSENKLVALIPRELADSSSDIELGVVDIVTGVASDLVSIHEVPN